MKKKSSEVISSSKKAEKKEGKIPLDIQSSETNNQPSEQREFLNEVLDHKESLGMVEDSLSANFITIPAGKLIYCNKAFLDLFGFKTKEEAFNYPVEKLYPSSADRANFLKELKKNKKLEGFEAVHVSVNGSVIHTLENMVGVFDDSGSLIKIMGNLVDISERIKTEKALRESENRYRELIELAADGILLGSHDGIIIGANSQMQKLTGRTLDQLIGKHVSELFSSDVLNKVPLRFDLLMKGETVFSERSILRTDGTFVDIEMNTKMMPDGSYQSIYRDISERRITEKALGRSEEKYRKTFLISPDSININRLEDGKYVSVNDGFIKIMGFSESEVVGKTSLELNIWVDPEDRKKLVEGLKKEGVVQNLESRFRKKNGEIRFGLMSASVLDLDGVPHIISITREITERKQAEEALQKSESKLQAIFSAMTDVILIIDDKGRYLEIAPTNPSLLYKTPTELLGKTAHEVFPKDQADFFLAHIKTCLAAKQATKMEYTLEIENKKIWFTATLSPLSANTILIVARDVTEAKFAEENLKISDATYRGILNTINDAIYIQDKDGTFLDVNEGAVRMYGYSREELIGKNPLFVAAEGKNDLQKVIEQINLAFEGTPQEFEFWGQRKNGQIFPKQVRLYKGVYFEKDVVIAIAKDITESKRAEDKLKENEEMFRNLVENITDVFYIADERGKMKYCSPNFFLFTGFTPQEILNHPYVRVVAPVDQRRVVEHYIGAERSGILDTSIELRVKKKDGSIFWAEQNTRFIRDEKENVLEYRTVARDITERKHAEEALKKSEEWFRNLFEKASDGIFHLSHRGELLAVNKAFATMHGYTVEEMQKMNLKDLDTPQTSILFPERMRRVLAGENLTFEVEHYHKNGHVFALEVTASMVTVGDEKFIMAFHRDITKRKQNEEELRKSEERFRLISNLTSDYIFSTKITTDGKIESDWVMGAFEKITGYTIEEYKSIGGWRAVLHPDDREKDFLDFQKLLNNEKVISEVRTYHKNGNIVWSRTYASPIWDDNAKKLIGIYGAVQDITEKKYAEELINESEKKYRKIAEGTKAILFNTNVRGQLIYANQAASEALGFENKDLVGKFYLTFVHPDDRTKVHSFFLSQLKKHERDRSMDFRYVNASGKVGWLSFLVNLLYIDGQVTGLTGVAQEITERKQAEEALRKSELHFRSVWENAASGMRLTNEEGVIIAVNNAFCQIVGKTKKELEGFHLSEVYSSQNSLSIQRKHQERFKTRTAPPLIEKEFILWNDKKVWLRVANSFIESEYEKPFLLGVFTDITEQKLAEGEIKKLSQAVEQSAGAIIITGLNGNIEYVNKKFEEVTGYTFAEVKGQNPRILKSSETPGEEYKEMWNTILAGNEWRGTFHNKRKDGSLYWEATMISAIKNNEGRITNFLAIKDDITQDKLKEELLKKSELHFRSIWESSLDGMRLTDKNGIIVSVNDAFAKLFEKEKSQIIGEDFEGVYSKNMGFDDVASFVRRFADRTIQPFIERDIMVWNGKPMSVELTNSFVEVEGQPTLLLSIFRDVTEKKQSEQKIQLLAHSIESIGECVSITDTNNHLLFVNDAFIKTYGYTREELIGNHISIIRTENDSRENLQQIITRTVDGGWKGEAMNRRKDGTTFPVSLSTSVIKDNGGNPIALIGVSSDITDTNKSREELILAKEKAEEANRVKTNFLENMSHELRTPMISILGFTEIIAEMDLPDEVKDMAAMMNKGGNRLMETLNIILDLAQIEKDRVLLKPAKTNISKIIEEVCGLFQQIANERNLYLRSEILTDELSIITDERIIRHAINNLINNGLKFTPNGGVTIKLSTEKFGDQNFAIIQVCDTGIGIPKDKQDFIWEEFRQASEGIGRSFEGNGLGLTITKNFIEQLKGEVGVESEVGKGSTFTVRIPYVENLDEEKPIQEETVVQAAAPIVKQEVKPDESLLKKVLYVEDEEISFSVVKHFLKSKVSLDWARNGQDGVVMAKGNKYKAILMDINLAKGIDGMQTTKLIRELPQYEKTPIIAITAFAMHGDKEEFLGAGCSHYISKPFTKASLLNLMGDALGEKLE